MSKLQSITDSLNHKIEDLTHNSSTCMERDLSVVQNSFSLSLAKLIELVQTSPNEILIFILDKKHGFLSLVKEIDVKQDLIPYAIIALGKACSSELYKDLNHLLIRISSDVHNILINIQRYLVSLQKQKVIDKYHRDSLLYLTVFLRKFQLTLPSSSLDLISMLLPLLTITCKKCLKDQNELDDIVSEKLKEIDEEQKLFVKHYSAFEVSEASKKEKLQLQDPPENFRSLHVLPTVDDIHLPCLFLRPNISKGKYDNTEHYLDVQFRLLREDYIKPLRDGIAEYLCLKKNNKSFQNCKSVRVYCNVSVLEEKFVDGDLLHFINFSDPNFSVIDWENSKRLITGSLLCLSSDDFHTMLFASVIQRDPKELKNGVLLVHFEEISEEVLNLNSSKKFVVIETTAYFEAYRHNLKALQKLKEKLLPMKRYIIDVEKTVNNPKYLLPTTTYDMRPMLIPLEKEYISSVSNKICHTTKYLYPDNIASIYQSVAVRDDNCWPSAADLNLDESQLCALKSAITKEFAIIQGPPGTGKTYVGLRVAQLLLHNIDKWFLKESNSLPILIVCYTNHALDQFLEGILLFTEKIVRIGGRGSNDLISKFQIKNLVKHAIYNNHIPVELSDDIYEIRLEIKNLKEKINIINSYLEESEKYVITESAMKDYIPAVHLNSLKRGDFRLDHELRKSKNTIHDWLELGNSVESLYEEKSKFQNFNRSTGTNVEIESEGEADIEFIENQRNIDFYDFDPFQPVKNKKITNVQETDEWKVQKKSKQKLNIRNELQRYRTMGEYQAMKIKNVWFLHISVRWQLYKYWLEKFITGKQEEYLNLQEKIKIAFKDQADLRCKQDIFVLRNSHVVGMTTTGAAKYRHIIQAMKPAILIIEEAAEILESHIITSLAPETQHVILIGDQQQLRPSPTVHLLAVKYGMNISLFERMIKNGVDYCRLSVQHRMRPDIAALIVPHIYSNLKNHKVVTEFENIKGLNKNVFFITHNFNELLIKDSKSKINEHEAKFLINLCQYLIFQGYKASQITVLTTYTGQLFVLKKLATDIVKDIRFTVVDNFQGEENDIILISFVRSNNEGEVGFLKVSNRICVALSRAKKGLYCIGNFELLAKKSDLWRKIVHTLTVNQSIGPSLCLICQNHPDIHNEVASNADFAAVPEGGCSQKCNYRLSCGHSCSLSCHPYDQEHENILCEKPCTKVCKEGHQCLKKCFRDCEPCPTVVKKTLSNCGHVIEAACGISESQIACPEPCMKICKEGHKCPQKCFEICEPCPIVVTKTLLHCKHAVNVACGISEFEIECPEPCVRTCKEGHKCPRKCFEECMCQVLVDKTLKKCGHIVKVQCGEKNSFIKCKNQCSKICKHGHQCSKKCFEICGPCTFLVDKTLTDCGHTVKTLCSKDEKKIKCYMKCNKILACGHECKNKCSELCTIKCLQEIEIKLSLCGHFLKVNCNSAKFIEEFQKICSEPCNKVLPCGHACKGSCSTCFLGRLHVVCDEPCQKILICGHKCKSKCYKSCPPCEMSCENRCIHRKCPRKCGIPCLKCFKPCNWSCSHKKCTRYCYEMCDRDQCDKPCPKILPCNHRCVGFCGEPCPEECQICQGKVILENNYSGYVYLEDCKHVVKESDLKMWLTAKLFASTQDLQKIQMKTCPKCNIVIRRNIRFNNIIKTCIADIEKIKLIAMYNKRENLIIQKSLLEHPSLTNLKNSEMYNHIIKILSSGTVRHIQELMNIGNLINIATEIESMTYCIFSMFVLKPFLENLVHYARSCREWLSQFICYSFLTVSQYQLEQLLKEVHRLRLLDILLKFASEKFFISSSPDFENCVQCLLNFQPFCDDNIEKFDIAFQNVVKSFGGNFLNLSFKNISSLTVVNMSGYWYKCMNGHINCIIKEDLVFEDCCVCKGNTINEIKNCLPISTTNINLESSTLSSNELHVKKNNFVSSELQSFNNSNIDGKQDELGKEICPKTVNCKQLITHIEDIKNTVVFDNDYSITDDLNGFLPCLLTKKINLICESQQKSCKEYDTKRNNGKSLSNHVRVSENVTECTLLSSQRFTRRQQTAKSSLLNASELSFENSLKNRSRTCLPETSVKENNNEMLNQERYTGTKPKNTAKLYGGYSSRGQSKSYNSFPQNLDNTSKSFKNNFHRGNWIKGNQIQNKATRSTSRLYYGRDMNVRQTEISKLQDSAGLSKNNSSNSFKYSNKPFEEGHIKGDKGEILQNNVRSTQHFTRSMSRPNRGPRGKRGPAEMSKLKNSTMSKNSSSNSLEYVKDFEKDHIKGSKGGK